MHANLSRRAGMKVSKKDTVRIGRDELLLVRACETTSATTFQSRRTPIRLHAAAPSASQARQRSTIRGIAERRTPNAKRQTRQVKFHEKVTRLSLNRHVLLMTVLSLALLK
jgi:hypothetical protein